MSGLDTVEVRRAYLAADLVASNEGILRVPALLALVAYVLSIGVDDVEGELEQSEISIDQDSDHGLWWWVTVRTFVVAKKQFRVELYAYDAETGEAEEISRPCEHCDETGRGTWQLPPDIEITEWCSCEAGEAGADNEAHARFEARNG